MKLTQRSVVMSEAMDSSARDHLLRADGQEDLCFALWRPSTGMQRRTAVVQTLVFPNDGERTVHGNVSFEPRYFERALSLAAAKGAGLALLHSHPAGLGWQDMSKDDVFAEQGHAPSVLGATDLPLLGMTIAGRDGAWSARHWERVAPKTYERMDCKSVRVTGEKLTVTFCDTLAPSPKMTPAQVRTVSAWGERQQEDLVRLRVGVVGAGSVGGFVAVSLARMGFVDVTLIDFDIVKEKNLDRLVYATIDDIGELKVKVLADHMRKCATARSMRVEPVVAAVYEEQGFKAALDCDVLISCVDRPWGRHVLNTIAFAHLIPVVDGGISVAQNRLGEISKADWKAHTVTIGRQCLSCLGQYNLGDVQLERQGMLDDPTYIEGLSKNHPLRAGENVFAFSMACASLQVLQLLSLFIAPLGRSNPGAQLYHFVGGFMEEPKHETCSDNCLFPTFTSSADHCKFDVTGKKP